MRYVNPLGVDTRKHLMRTFGMSNKKENPPTDCKHSRIQTLNEQLQESSFKNDLVEAIYLADSKYVNEKCDGETRILTGAWKKLNDDDLRQLATDIIAGGVNIPRNPGSPGNAQARNPGNARAMTNGIARGAVIGNPGNAGMSPGNAGMSNATTGASGKLGSPGSNANTVARNDGNTYRNNAADNVSGRSPGITGMGRKIENNAKVTGDATIGARKDDIIISPRRITSNSARNGSNVGPNVGTRGTNVSTRNNVGVGTPGNAQRTYNAARSNGNNGNRDDEDERNAMIKARQRQLLVQEYRKQQAAKNAAAKAEVTRRAAELDKAEAKVAHLINQILTKVPAMLAALGGQKYVDVVKKHIYILPTAVHTAPSHPSPSFVIDTKERMSENQKQLIELYVDSNDLDSYLTKNNLLKSNDESNNAYKDVIDDAVKRNVYIIYPNESPPCIRLLLSSFTGFSTPTRANALATQSQVADLNAIYDYFIATTTPKYGGRLFEATKRKRSGKHTAATSAGATRGSRPARRRAAATTRRAAPPPRGTRGKPHPPKRGAPAR